MPVAMGGGGSKKKKPEQEPAPAEEKATPKAEPAADSARTTSRDDGGASTTRSDAAGAGGGTSEADAARIKELEEKLAAAEAGKKTAEDENAKLKEQVNAAEDKAKAAEDKAKAAEEASSKEPAAADTSALDAKIKELEGKVSELEASLKDAETAKQAAQVERDEAKEELAAAAKAKEDTAGSAAGSDADQLAEAQKQVIKLQKQNEIIMKKLVEREGEKRALQAQLDGGGGGGGGGGSAAAAVSASYAEDLKLNKIDNLDNSTQLFPSDDMGDKLRGYLGGHDTIMYKDVQSVYTQVPPSLLFDWFVQVCLQCKRLGKLITLTQVVTKSLKTMEEMMNDVTKETCSLLEAERATVFASDTKKRELYSKVAANTKHVKAEVVAKVDTGLKKKKGRIARTIVRAEAVTIRIPDDAGIAGHVYQNGDTLNIEDAYDDYRFNQEVDKKMGLRTKAVLCAGVTAHGGARMGVIQVMNKKVKHAKGPPTGDGTFDDDDEKKLEGLALRVGIQLYRTQLFEDIRAICNVNLLLDDVMTSYVEEVSLQRTMEETSKEVCNLLDCERATVFMAESVTQELFAIVNDGVEIRFPWDKGIAGECFTKKQSVNIPDPYKDKRFNPEFDKKNNFKTRSILCMPLYDNDTNVIGVLQAINKGDDEEDYFTEEDEHYFRRTVTQAGANLAYAKMFEDAALL